VKFVTFGQGRLGIVDGTEIIDVTTACGVTDAGPDGPLAQAIERGTLPVALDDERLAEATREPLATSVLRAPLPHPKKIVGAPVNYLAHKDEMREQLTVAELGVFLKAPTSVIGPGQSVQLPYSDVLTEQEGELAVVIGRTARHVSVEQALDYVFGYTCLLDITIRSTEDRSTRKSFDTFTPLGPQVVTADEVGDASDLMLRCWVNGELRQETSTALLIFGVADLIAYSSSVMTLEPGDVIATGTPAGVGPLKDRDEIVVEIERVGRLQASVSGSGALPYAQRRQAALA
jgi:2-keto-4-pentenoate hydratase/2-oxohepta-3-ene-1,7-dioic acid hydratase in catechol pathway